ncbi:MAG TPA: protoporphyrinogen oxidase [Acidimicrobiales bacterium]|nr:protoporphyrinogen oxidase [Acidimicrobiales bacterium]
MRVAVVGGGIAGLAAAHELADRSDVEVVVLEAGDHMGGKVATAPFAGVDLDLAPDAFLARRPEAVQLCRELGLEDRLVAPASGSAWVWTRGRLRRLPTGLLLGVPTDVRSLLRSGVLSPLGALRASLEPLLPGSPLGSDATIGSVMRRRLGHEAHERLIDPLLGGINAGDTDALGIDAVAPQLAAAARHDASVVKGARHLTSQAPPQPGAPVFLTLPEGLGALIDALTDRLTVAGVELRTNTEVAELTHADGHWSLTTSAGEQTADAVVLAVPAFAAAPLLEPHAPSVASTMAGIEHASVALVALAYADRSVPGPLDGSGFLVPRVDGRLMTACSWASSKWAHLGRPGQVLLRVSAGRAGDERAMAMDDDALVARLRVELEAAMGIRDEPIEVRVTRWHRAFPQYGPGHLTRMADARARLAAELPTLALAGAALGGVGLPACIGTGRIAAQTVADAVTASS